LVKARPAAGLLRAPTLPANHYSAAITCNLDSFITNQSETCDSLFMQQSFTKTSSSLTFAGRLLANQSNYPAQLLLLK
jgi:hypothetical protein